VSGSGFLDLLTLPGCWQWGGPLGCLNPYISECGCGRPEDGGAMLLLLLLVSTSATSNSNSNSKSTFVVLTLGRGCDSVAARTTTILHSRRLAKVTNEELAQTRLTSKMSYLTAQIFHFFVVVALFCSVRLGSAVVAGF